MSHERLSKLLEREERRVRHAYLDSKGYLTIGIGRLIDQRRGGGLSDDEIDLLLANDIRKREVRLETLPWYVRLDEARKDVVLAMAFQLGVGGVLKFRKMVEALRVGDYEVAADEMLDSDWARADSPARAERMALAMRSGVLEV